MQTCRKRGRQEKLRQEKPDHGSLIALLLRFPTVLLLRLDNTVLRRHDNPDRGWRHRDVIAAVTAKPRRPVYGCPRGANGEPGRAEARRVAHARRRTFEEPPCERWPRPSCFSPLRRRRRRPIPRRPAISASRR